eukprot:9698597-Heterocapsa_arctica.AAC.1
MAKWVRITPRRRQAYRMGWAAARESAAPAAARAAEEDLDAAVETVLEAAAAVASAEEAEAEDAVDAVLKAATALATAATKRRRL